MTPTERVRSVLDAMERHPAVAWVTRAQSGQLVAKGGYRVNLCKAGTPDVIGMLRNGKFLGIEVKANERARKYQGGDPTKTKAAQRTFGEVAKECGAVYGMVCSAEEAWELVSKEGA